MDASGSTGDCLEPALPRHLGRRKYEIQTVRLPFNQIAEGGEGFTLFCPNCLSEYEEGMTRCESCEVDLVEAEEGDGEIEFGPLLEVTDSDLFARVACTLDEAGIAWFVQSEQSLGLLPRNGRPEAGRPGETVATVYVDRDRMEKARELVGEPETVAAG